MTGELLLRSVLSLQGSAGSRRELWQTALAFLKTNQALNVVMITLSCAWLGRISVSELVLLKIPAGNVLSCLLCKLHLPGETRSSVLVERLGSTEKLF